MRAARFCGVAGTIALLGLGGCSEPTSLALTGASLISFAATDKFLMDHVASWATGKDCSMAAAGADGRYCRPDEEIATPGFQTLIAESPLYCYRTLAEITCYESPDPQASASRRVQ